MMGGAMSASLAAVTAVEPTPFRDEAAARDRLTRLGARATAEAVEELRLRCAVAADPDLALAGAERYADAAGALPADPRLLDALVALCGASPMLAGLLAFAPHLLRRAACSALRRRDEAGLRRVLARAAARLDPDDVPGFHRLLRRLRAREVVRISLRDLRRVRMSDVTGELSALATACLDAAIRFHDRRLRARHGAPAGLEGREPGAGFCALAMGKLGARELNFSSDVDLIYVYGADGTTTGEAPVTHFAYHAKLAELVTESIATPTDDGFVFRVDLNLRPDGRSGPIVNSVRAAELYYQSYGRSWERNALVKARAAAGDVAVGEELLRLLEPFIWRRSLDLEVLSEIQAMKARIDARAGAEGKADLKLGRGGIREVEFFVSALQLLHGGKNREVRERAVLPALDRLLFAGIVPARDRDALADAYLFLRRAEHRVQMVDGRQTHALPPPEERLALARAMGFSSLERFEEALAQHRERVASLFADLLGRGAGEVKLDPELALLSDPQVPDGRRAEIALRRGLADPDRALAALDALGRRRTPFSPTGDPAAAVALLHEALATPDPDQALGFLADFAAALPNAEPYFRLLAGDHRLARLLLSLFGSSDFLSKRFLRHPELLDTLLREDTFIAVKTADTFRSELQERLQALREHGEQGPDALLEDRLGALRRYKNEEVLRIAVHDIAGALPLPGVAEQLSDLAESPWGSWAAGSWATTPTSTSSSSTATRRAARTASTPASRSGSCLSYKCRSARGTCTRSTPDSGRPATRARSSPAPAASPATTPAAPATRRCGASSGNGRRSCARASWLATRRCSRRCARRCSSRRSGPAPPIAHSSRPRSGGCASGSRRASGRRRSAARTRSRAGAASSTSSSRPSSSSSRTATPTRPSGRLPHLRR